MRKNRVQNHAIELATRKAVTHPGLSMASAPGLAGVEREHILTYQPGKIWLLKALLFESDLTVCNSVWVWARHLTYLIYALLLMLILGNSSGWAFEDATEELESGDTVQLEWKNGCVSAITRSVLCVQLSARSGPGTRAQRA